MRAANLHVVISGTRLGILGFNRGVEEPEENLRAWVVDQTYQAVSEIARSHDCYAMLLTRDPLLLG